MTQIALSLWGSKVVPKVVPRAVPRAAAGVFESRQEEKAVFVPCARRKSSSLESFLSVKVV